MITENTNEERSRISYSQLLRPKKTRDVLVSVVTKRSYFSAALELWISREVRVLYSIGNCFLGMKVRSNAMSLLRQLAILILLVPLCEYFFQLLDLHSSYLK